MNQLNCKKKKKSCIKMLDDGDAFEMVQLYVTCLCLLKHNS